MEFFLTSLTVTLGVLFVIYIRNKVKRNDLELIEKEISQDFNSEFETDFDGSLTEKGMRDLVNWWSPILLSMKLEYSRKLRILNEFK